MPANSRRQIRTRQSAIIESRYVRRALLPFCAALLLVAPLTLAKKKKPEQTQTLPPPKDLPLAVAADTSRLSFRVSPLSAKGLLSAQVREALRALLRDNRSATIVKLRAFVAGTGDLRRVPILVGEIFTDKHQPLPAVTVVQAGALPLDGAQVLIESTAIEKRTVNPEGLGFFAGETGADVHEAVEKLRDSMRNAGADAAGVLRVSCFVSSLEEERSAAAEMASAFPGSASAFVQMQRGPVIPKARCEGVARLNRAPAGASELRPDAALVNSPHLVLSGAQLAFGAEPKDLQLAFERLRRTLGQMQSGFSRVLLVEGYVTNPAMRQHLQASAAAELRRKNLPWSILPFEALPSIDASAAIELIATE